MVLAIQSRKGQQDPLGEQVLWAQQRGGLRGILGRSPAQLTSRKRSLAHNAAARCNIFARKPASPRGCLAFPKEGVGQELVSKPRWVNKQLGALGMELGRRSPLSNWSLLDGGASCRPAGYERGMTAETVTKLCQEGQVKEAVEALGVMVQGDYHISKFVFYTVLKECVAKRNLPLGRRVHALMVKKGYESDTFLCNHILRMYSSHARLQEAMDVFGLVAKPDVFLWSSMISAYVKLGQDKQAIELYHRMRRSGVKPDGHVLVAALQACAKGTDLKSGQQVHADVLVGGAEQDVFVCSCLVDMYAKCGSLKDAQRVFDGLSEKNAVTWNAMIAGYSQQGMGAKALRLYSAMEEGGMAAPTSVTFICLLQACASMGTPALEKGKHLHVQIRQQGLEADIVVGGSLVNMYAKCGSLEDARGVFDRLGHKNVVAWNAMIAGYSQQGMGQEALALYRAMQEEEGTIPPNSVTFLCLLQACGSLAALHVGRQLHAQITDQGLQGDVLIAGSLIDMYGKCGSMFEARHVFDTSVERDVVAWSALIAGYTRQGNSDEVFNLICRMRQNGIQPDGITFLSVLTVCSHAGLVNKGREYFESMSKHYGITPTLEHYTCMVDLLGRAGQLHESLVLIRTMPLQPNAAVWHTLIGACRKWKNVEVGCHAFHEAVKLNNEDAVAYVLMSNVYTSAQMWDQAEELQSRRLRIKAWKQPGQSWWTDMDGHVHSFLVGYKTQTGHEESESFPISEEGYVPHLDSWSRALSASDDG